MSIASTVKRRVATFIGGAHPDVTVRRGQVVTVNAGSFGTIRVDGGEFVMREGVKVDVLECLDGKVIFPNSEQRCFFGGE